MHYKNMLGYRYPKGPFAMISVYTFTGAAVVTSTVFSLLLFLSIDDNTMMKVLFGTLAIIFEAGKFYAWYEFGERRAHKNYTGAITALVFYLVLAAISIGGSIGGINSATNKAQGVISIQEAKVAAYDRQIAAIEKQIELNNLAAEKYIEMERIATGVTRIQQQNNKLREEQIKLATERDSLPPVTQGSAIGLIDSLADAFSVSQQAAQFGLVVFLSILLDLFAAFFVGVIGEELRFRRFYQHHTEIDITPEDVSKPIGYLEHKPALNEPVTADAASAEEALSLEDKVKKAVQAGVITCSKKAVGKHFLLSTDDVDTLFEQMMLGGLIAKKANNHYYLVA
ncbi:Preprotein translocase subunit SecY [Grimontia sp. NTOU-MAR1]|uniref:Preprotein translocase subunit SecY n=1 Tax=Grimontia sp. NTOU-MAR1 TaxID=3111011 RepID=UPI002DBDD116|nr:Preprotein translocase subunit SecY [Grimontia sp. NTOU-MAR1]WRV98120.1 Preprotein translocase subunit SecY [Grimontia sp. NTOU-MAR1]